MEDLFIQPLQILVILGIILVNTLVLFMTCMLNKPYHHKH